MTDSKITSSNVAVATHVLSEILKSPLADKYRYGTPQETTETLLELHTALVGHFSQLPNFDVRYLTDGYPKS